MSQPALALVAAPPPAPGAEEAAWGQWLTAHVDPSWRPGEWDASVWLFTGDLNSSRTRAWPCRTPGCRLTTRRHNARCDACRRARLAVGVSEEDFDRSPRRSAVRSLVAGPCAVGGCESEVHCAGLCHRHERAWRRDGRSIEDFLADACPLRRLEPCRVPGCGRERIHRRGLCRFHEGRFLRDGGRGHAEDDVVSWAASQPPRLGAHQFSLAPLAPLVRWELLYALQRRDATPPPLDPLQIRILVARLVGADSLRRADPAQVCEAGGAQYNADIRWFFQDLHREVERAWHAYTGADPMAGDVWAVAHLDLGANASRPWPPASEGTIDFATVGLEWLRGAVKGWARETRPYLQELRQALAATRVASATLEGAGRTDPARLDAGDFTRVVDALAAHRRADGTLYSAAHRNLMLFRFCEVIDHARVAGLMTAVPESFRPLKRRYRVVDEPNEEQVGKALPESVIATLDVHLHLLGQDGRAGWMSGADLKEMHRSIYRLLRDTGRRPGEVVTLGIGCVEVIDGTHNLIYTNHKAARMRRRLPITNDTASAILAWQARRVARGGPPALSRWLFPSPQQRSRQSFGHLTTAAVGRAFRAWVARIPVIDSELLGPDGTPLPFDRRLVIPYALRHSYAQRHADAGVPVDVLRELMDHATVQTTMGYYSVGLKRKVAAIARVGSLAVDASGRPAPFADATAYERASVSVPFGNCTEPANVRAGGGHCPIRFQCAGCGFYRPDPSYLPALEEHIASLRADRETARAMGAAGYVMANLAAEIDAFARVAEKMQRRLEGLSAEERAEVEEASRTLRRARATRRIPVTASGPGQAG